MTQISILGVDNVLFAVGDLATARAFYEGRLGLKVKFAAPEHGIVGYALGSEEPGLVVRQEVLSYSTPRATPKVWLEVADARVGRDPRRRRRLAPCRPLRDTDRLDGRSLRSVGQHRRADRLRQGASYGATPPCIVGTDAPAMVLTSSDRIGLRPVHWKSGARTAGKDAWRRIHRLSKRGCSLALAEP